MDCQVCSKRPATVHITEVFELSTQEGVPSKLEQKHVCDDCARVMQLPHMPVMKKTAVNIWKLLQQSAQKSLKEGGLKCPDCGMTLAEFRSKGRLGCPNDYEVFRQHLDPLLQRIHNATEHSGRVPGLDDDEIERRRAISELREKLESAIREEAYEHAARLRDQLAALETDAG